MGIFNFLACEVQFWNVQTGMFCEQKLECTIFISNAFTIFAGDRLFDFKILIGNEFSQSTQAADIGSWSECAHVSGKTIFQLCIPKAVCTRMFTGKQ